MGNNPRDPYGRRRYALAKVEQLHRDMAKRGVTLEDLKARAERELERRRERRIAEEIAREHGW